MLQANPQVNKHSDPVFFLLSCVSMCVAVCSESNVEISSTACMKKCVGKVPQSHTHSPSPFMYWVVYTACILGTLA